eukprot:scaffold1954_cov268-Pinguiococcus_pyrenoidosus.AAC.218
MAPLRDSSHARVLHAQGPANPERAHASQENLAPRLHVREAAVYLLSQHIFNLVLGERRDAEHESGSRRVQIAGQRRRNVPKRGAEGLCHAPPDAGSPLQRRFVFSAADGIQVLEDQDTGLSHHAFRDDVPQQPLALAVVSPKQSGRLDPHRAQPDRAADFIH